MTLAQQSVLDSQNAKFWSELCGSHMARSLGITDHSPESLRRFDESYFNYYPYLSTHIRFDTVAGLDMLEIGLGYGTVSQRLAESGARFTGLDIADGPVQIVNLRLRQAGLPGNAHIGSIIDPPFDHATFDRIVAIGCLHHTGDLPRAIDNCWNLLKNGGQMTFMVHNAYSYRRWMNAPGQTARLWIRERFGLRGVAAMKEMARAMYDTDAAGNAAPHTDVVSVTSLRALCRKFREFSAIRENIAQEAPFSRHTREDLLATSWPRIVGLDLYVTCTK